MKKKGKKLADELMGEKGLDLILLIPSLSFAIVILLFFFFLILFPHLFLSFLLLTTEQINSSLFLFSQPNELTLLSSSSRSRTNSSLLLLTVERINLFSSSFSVYFLRLLHPTYQWFSLLLHTFSLTILSKSICPKINLSLNLLLQIYGIFTLFGTHWFFYIVQHHFLSRYFDPHRLSKPHIFFLLFVGSDVHVGVGVVDRPHLKINGI